MGCGARRVERRNRDSTWLYSEAASSAQRRNALINEF